MNSKNYFLVFMLILVNFISLFMIVSDLENFIFELFILVILLLVSVMMLYSLQTNKPNAHKLAMIFFAAGLINTIILFPLLTLNQMCLGLIAITVNLIGFNRFTTPKKTRIIKRIRPAELPKTISMIEEPTPTFAEYKQITAPEPETKPARKKPAVKKEFKPGKFIASKTGVKFHTPKCDWAKRINKKNRVWLKDKAQARKKGYKPCSCIKNRI